MSSGVVTDRRNLIRAGAWSVPVIAVAAAMPAASASTAPPVIALSNATARFVGAKSYPEEQTDYKFTADWEVTVTLVSGEWPEWLRLTERLSGEGFPGYQDHSAMSGSSVTYTGSLPVTHTDNTTLNIAASEGAGTVLDSIDIPIQAADPYSLKLGYFTVAVNKGYVATVFQVLYPWGNPVPKADLPAVYEIVNGESMEIPRGYIDADSNVSISMGQYEGIPTIDAKYDIRVRIGSWTSGSMPYAIITNEG